MEEAEGRVAIKDYRGEQGKQRLQWWAAGVGARDHCWQLVQQGIWLLVVTKSLLAPGDHCWPREISTSRERSLLAALCSERSLLATRDCCWQHFEGIKGDGGSKEERRVSDKIAYSGQWYHPCPETWALFGGDTTAVNGGTVETPTFRGS
ncbi:hypothetical protein B296_00050383 [Ensete ventricosum]|uniref:Uncharacterized protein n=1 Tax=Ensete ventricosum TaxID=4639 RepID=A0A426YLH5_ENSVE|nr:hypothetical protein B296_00050383 [Ensete ventricosum]